jgi:fructosamine-3-kinase
MTSRIPGGVLDGVKEVLNLPNLSSIKEFLFAGGGSINQGGKLKTTTGSFFLKWNDDKKFPAMFEDEGKVLHLLHLQNAIRIHNVIFVA